MIDYVVQQFKTFLGSFLLDLQCFLAHWSLLWTSTYSSNCCTSNWTSHDTLRFQPGYKCVKMQVKYDSERHLSSFCISTLIKWISTGCTWRTDLCTRVFDLCCTWNRRTYLWAKFNDSFTPASDVSLSSCFRREMRWFGRSYNMTQMIFRSLASPQGQASLSRRRVMILLLHEDWWQFFSTVVSYSW